MRDQDLLRTGQTTAPECAADIWCNHVQVLLVDPEDRCEVRA